MNVTSTIIGLVRLAAAEEEMLLADAPSGEAGSAACWAAVPTVAHNTAFEHEQVVRLRSVAEGVTPPEFPAVDHRSEDLYRSLGGESPAEVAERARSTSDALVRALLDLDVDELVLEGRHEWLRGRSLWLQVVVRGFWHPLGHVAEYHRKHGAPARALALADHALATAQYLDAPAAVVGMCLYSRACERAKEGDDYRAADDLREAISLNSDLRDNAVRDGDLAAIRDSGALDAVFGTRARS